MSRATSAMHAQLVDTMDQRDSHALEIERLKAELRRSEIEAALLRTENIDLHAQLAELHAEVERAIIGVNAAVTRLKSPG